ncbi:hypothetical protein CMQ_1700 [Grosmannia clavigera kw1407]|uniref:Uncharacterized protein n=1 Tax=Grosmannia clavigera (strain kw1407 / UAMH 11150) TaxID=655863 RepID=F0XBW4_GROCL|nr:uncharacterized protein CMQ_1700 [Grosmannia clavigera kw1407]EFX04772.1 hypothetical protein CMQ_1700 [Grosmannia clavigera kw1407]
MSCEEGATKKKAATTRPPSFMLETRVIPALYYVVTKYRHPSVRCAALDSCPGGRRAGRPGGFGLFTAAQKQPDTEAPINMQTKRITVEE